MVYEIIFIERYLPSLEVHMNTPPGKLQDAVSFSLMVAAAILIMPVLLVLNMSPKFRDI